MYSLSHFFTSSYWFANVPTMTSSALWVQIIFYALLVAGSLSMESWIVSNKADKFLAHMLRRVKTLLLVMGITGFVFLFFRYQFIPLLSRRFMYLVWLTMLAVWVGFLVPEFKKIPKRRQDAEEIDQIKRYLPH